MHRAGITIQLGSLRHSHPLTRAQRGDVVIRQRLDRAHLLPGIWQVGRQRRQCDQRDGERQEWISRLHGYGLSGIKRRTIAARINSAIQPNIRPRAGLTVTVTKAVAPITQRHDGLPSNRRREIAKSVPAKISRAPTAPIGISPNSVAAWSAKAIARTSSTAPKMIGARPVRAPKRNCATSPPAPWHIGIAPKGHSSTFARPDDNANRPS